MWEDGHTSMACRQQENVLVDHVGKRWVCICCIFSCPVEDTVSVTAAALAALAASFASISASSAAFADVFAVFSAS